MTEQTTKPKGTFAKLMSSPPLPEAKGHMAGKPENLKTGIQEITISGKPETPKVEHRDALKAIKYSTQLHPDLIKQLKQYALGHDVKDYEVVQEALTEYLAKKQS